MAGRADVCEPMASRYTREEVAQHASIDDAWVIVDDRVFDVTPFLGIHPGGVDVTESRLGSDISSVLRAQEPHQHSATAFEVLEQYCIGALEDFQVWF